MGPWNCDVATAREYRQINKISIAWLYTSFIAVECVAVSAIGLWSVALAVCTHVDTVRRWGLRGCAEFVLSLAFGDRIIISNDSLVFHVNPWSVRGIRAGYRYSQTLLLNYKLRRVSKNKTITLITEENV